MRGSRVSETCISF